MEDFELTPTRSNNFKLNPFNAEAVGNETRFLRLRATKSPPPKEDTRVDVDSEDSDDEAEGSTYSDSVSTLSSTVLSSLHEPNFHTERKQLLMRVQEAGDTIFDKTFVSHKAIVGDYPDYDKYDKREVTRMEGFFQWFLGYDKYFTEKLLIVYMEYFQLYALLWVFPWRWPRWWYRITQFTLLFNGDFFSWRNDRGEIEAWFPFMSPLVTSGIRLWTYLWSAVALTVFGCWVIVPMMRSFRFRFEVERILFVAVQVLYLPTLIATVMFGACNYQGLQFYNCEMTNGTLEGAMKAIPSMILALIFLLGVPINYYLCARPLLLYTRNSKQETYIMSLEVEQGLNLSNRFRRERYHLVNSLQRNMVWYYIFVRPLIKVTIVAAIISLPNVLDDVGQTAHWGNIQITTLIPLFIVTLSVIVEMFRPVYRLKSSNIVYQLVTWTNIVNMLFGWASANELRSPFLVESIVLFLLGAFNSVSLLGLIIGLILLKVFRQKWPVNEDILTELRTEYAHYIHMIKEGYVLYNHAMETVPEFVRVDLIEQHIRQLKACYEEAIHEQNPLQETLEDIIMKLEEQYFLYNKYTLFPNPHLQAVMSELKTEADRRSREFVLLSFERRVTLLKLLAVNAFIGRRKLQVIEFQAPADDTPAEEDNQVVIQIIKSPLGDEDVCLLPEEDGGDATATAIASPPSETNDNQQQNGEELPIPSTSGVQVAVSDTTEGNDDV